MGWIAQPLGTWTVFSAEGELCAGESVAAWEVGIPGMQRFNVRCSKGATVVCTNVERERRADYGQPLPSRPRNAPANTTRTPTLGPCRKASSAFRKGFRPIPVHVVLDHTSKTLPHICCCWSTVAAICPTRCTSFVLHLSSGRDAHSCCTLCSRTRVVSICASLSPRCVA